MAARSTDRRVRTGVHGELTVLRPATRADAALLVAWHADPEVARFWDDERFSHDEMVSLLERPELEPYVVEVDGQPLGYLQVWFDSASPGACGLDMFLIPSGRGSGFGPDAARAIVRHLLVNGRTRVTVDPYEWNDGAIRAWTRAGFQEIERHEPDDDHRESWVLMVFTEQRERR